MVGGTVRKMLIAVNIDSTRQAVGRALAVSKTTAMLLQTVEGALRTADNDRRKSFIARSAATRARSGPLAAPSP